MATKKPKEKSTKELLKDIIKKLDKILAVTATQGKDEDEQIKILRSFKWEWDEIGIFVGLTADAARKRHARKNN